VATERLDSTVAALKRTRDLYRSILAERNVATLLGAGVASELGDWFNTVALISLSFHFTESSLGVGGMFAVRMVTRLIVQGPAGTLVDRYAGRGLLFSSQAAMAIIATSFALLAVVPELWLLYLLVILLEVANAVARPAFMAELKAEAPENQRAAANGALFASSTTAQLLGPPLGAFVLAWFGPAVVFVLNGLTFAGVAFAVAQLHGGLRGSPRTTVAHDDSHSSSADSNTGNRIGYRWLLRRQDLSLFILVCLSLALLVQATVTLFVLRANALGLGDSGIGIFYMAVAIGSVTGSVIAGARAQHTAPLYPAAIAMGICAIALAVFGAAASVVIALLALVIAGFATDFYEVVGLTHFQGSVPDAVYGRLFSVFLIALSAGALVGALAGPVLEQSFGLETALIVLATPALALALLLMVMSRTWGSPDTALSA
jgi:predicted MFS family arabinose efflux permease